MGQFVLGIFQRNLVSDRKRKGERGKEWREGVKGRGGRKGQQLKACASNQYNLK